MPELDLIEINLVAAELNHTFLTSGVIVENSSRSIKRSKFSAGSFVLQRGKKERFEL